MGVSFVELIVILSRVRELDVYLFIYLLKYYVKFFIDLNIQIHYWSAMTRKIITSSIETELIKKLKYLAVDTEKPLNQLLEEAIQDLLKKYEKKGQK